MSERSLLILAMAAAAVGITAIVAMAAPGPARAPTASAADAPCSDTVKRLPEISAACAKKDGYKSAYLVMKRFVMVTRELYNRRTGQSLPLNCSNCHRSMRNFVLRESTLDAEPFSGGNSPWELYDALSDAVERWRAYERPPTRVPPEQRR